jgi:DNA-binding transcriptional MerR regulator
MNSFSIKDLEQLSGIKAHTIRVWEQRYGIIKPKRTDTNIRFYSNEELKIVLNISLLNRYGYKISHIDKMNAKEVREKIFSLSHSDAQEERLVNELIQCMIDLEVEKFEEALDNCIKMQGIEKTTVKIVFTFLEKVGVLWQTNHINPAQEHLVTNIIRQKLILAIENIKTPIEKEKTVLLYLPEGEYHELCLLFLSYIIKNRGIYVLYLGSNIPLKDVLYVVNHKKPLYLYSHLTAIGHSFNLDKYLTQASTKLQGTKLILSGQLIQGYKKSIPNNIELKKSLVEVINHIKSI